MWDAAEDAVDASETEEAPGDEVVEMSRRWSSRSGQSWSATGRRGPHVFSRRDTPRHVHVHKHDRGLSSFRVVTNVRYIIT